MLFGPGPQKKGAVPYRFAVAPPAGLGGGRAENSLPLEAKSPAPRTPTRRRFGPPPRTVSVKRRAGNSKER